MDKISKLAACLLMGLLLVASVSLAEEKSFEINFAYSDEEQPDSFRLYERLEKGKVIAADNIPGNERMVAFTTDASKDCHTWFIVAITRGVESMPSNAITWCPDALPPYVGRPLKVEGELILRVVE